MNSSPSKRSLEATPTSSLARTLSAADAKAAINTLMHAQPRSVQLAETVELLTELAKRFPSHLLVFETPTGIPGQTQIRVQYPTTIWTALGLLSWADVFLKKMANNMVQPGQEGVRF